MNYKELFTTINRHYVPSDCFLQKNARHSNTFREVLEHKLITPNTENMNAQLIAEGIASCALACGKRVFMLSCNLYNNMYSNHEKPYTQREFSGAVATLRLITVVPSESGSAAIYMVKPYTKLWNLIEQKPYFMEDQHILDSCLTMRRPLFPYAVKVEEIKEMCVEQGLCPTPETEVVEELIDEDTGTQEQKEISKEQDS